MRALLYEFLSLSFALVAALCAVAILGIVAWGWALSAGSLSCILFLMLLRDAYLRAIDSYRRARQ